MKALINLVHELRQLPCFALVAAAYGLGSEVNKAYLIIQPHHGLTYRVALPAGSIHWLRLVFQYEATWTEDSGPDDTGRFSVFACSPMQFAYETFNSACYWEKRWFGMTKLGEIPWCRFVRATL